MATRAKIPERTTTRRNPSWGWTRLIVAYGLLEWALWTTGRTQQIASVAFITWIAVTTVSERRRLRELGLGLSGLRGASIALAVAVIASGALLCAAWMLGTLRPLYGSRPLTHALGYMLWATVQEFVLNSYFFLTLEDLLPRSRYAMIAAVILFALAHIPNLILLVGTLLASMFFVSVFRRYRNIYPLGIAHGLLGLTLALTIPDIWIRHMRVGIGFLLFVAK